MSADGAVGRVAVVCLTPSAARAARFLAASIGADLHLHALVEGAGGEDRFERIAQRIERLWNQRDRLVVFAPVGVVVRSIAPLLEHKTRDPGVVAVDALSRWAIPVAGGHEGGANALAQIVSNILGSEPVVTTASEAARDLVVGIGCRRGVSTDLVMDAVDAALSRLGFDATRVRTLATASPKSRESGIREAAARLGLPLLVVHDLEIRSRRRVRRTAASRHVGLPSVSQSSALAAGRRTKCLLNGFRRGPVMVAVAQERCGWWESAPAIDWTEPVAPRTPSPLPGS